jgi:hypothetical protein
MSRTVSVVAALLICAVCQAADLPFALIPHVQTAPAIDGALADPVWNQAAILPSFALLDGSGSPTQQTEARLCHDGERLYLGVICHEAFPAKIQASPAKRDSAVWADDSIEVFIGDTHYYHLIFNAVGAIADEECRGEAKDMAWDADVKVATGRSEGAWTLTVSVPLKQVGLDRAGEHGLNICRNEIPQRELSCWSPTLNGFHQPARFGRAVLGDGPQALTGLQWGSPWPGANSLSLSTVGEGPAQTALSLTAGKSSRPVALKVGEEGRQAYDLDGLGPMTLGLTVRAGDRLLGREYCRLTVTDYRPQIAALSQRLASMPARARALQSAVQATRDVADLEKAATRPQDATAATWPQVGEKVAALSRTVDAIRLRASAIAKAGNVSYGLGVQSSLVKMLKDDPFSGEVESPIVLSAARDEYEAAQLVVFAFDQPLQKVALEFSDLTLGRRTLSKRSLSWRLVGYIKTEKPTYAVRYVGLWPDPLIPTDGFDVDANSFESAWITVHVPRGTAPGDYHGTVAVKPANAPARSSPITVHVYGFTLPRNNHIKTSFGCGVGGDLDPDKWWHNMLDHRISPTGMAGADIKPARFDLSAFDTIAFSARQIDGELGNAVRAVVNSDRAGQQSFGPLPLSGNWQEFIVPLGDGREAISSLGLSLAGPAKGAVEIRDLRAVGNRAAMRIGPRPEQWSASMGTKVAAAEGAIRIDFATVMPPGQKWLADWPGAMVSAWEAGNVPVKLDFTRFDDVIGRYQPLGLTATTVNVPSAGYDQPEEAALKQLRQSGTAAVAGAWEQHLREKGWLPMAYTYMADEPEPKFFPTLNAILAEVHRGAPDLANMMTARGAGAPGLHNVDIWCPEVYSFNPEGAKAEQAKGREVWWYVAFSTRHPFPNYWIDYPALDCRVHFWMSWKHKLDGILYWSMNYRTWDAWKTGMCYPGANGDGHLTYPAKDGGVVDSIRWEAIRDGAEDYEYFWLLNEAVKMAEKQGIGGDLIAHAKRLLAIDDNVVRSFKDYNPDPKALIAARNDMAEVIEALCRKLGAEPKDVPLQPRRAIPAAAPNAAAATPETIQMPVGAGAVALKAAGGGGALLYNFEADQPFAVDATGNGNHGVVTGGEIAEGRFGKGLKLSGEGSAIVGPSAASVLGGQCSQGTLALWVKPDYDPQASSDDTWSGWTVFLYAQHTNGNGLPDGYNEIGLSQHGKTLFGKVSTTKDMGPFPSVPVPLHKGQWTHLALTWSPTARVLYVDGKPVAQVQGNFAPVTLDGFPVTVGRHPPTGRWNFAGTVDDVLVSARLYTPEEIEKLASGPAK